MAIRPDDGHLWSSSYSTIGWTNQFGADQRPIDPFIVSILPWRTRVNVYGFYADPFEPFPVKKNFCAEFPSIFGAFSLVEMGSGAGQNCIVPTNLTSVTYLQLQAA